MFPLVCLTSKISLSCVPARIRSARQQTLRIDSAGGGGGGGGGGGIPVKTSHRHKSKANVRLLKNYTGLPKNHFLRFFETPL